MRRAVLNVVGLSARDLSSGVMPRLAARAAKGSVAKVRPAFPAVTCTAQSDYLTGKTPSAHGIVGNGWYDRALSEVQWTQALARVPMGRLATPDDIAAATEFLLGPSASFLTGIDLLVDGGVIAALRTGGRGADPLVDEGDAFRELLVGVDHRRLWNEQL